MLDNLISVILAGGEGKRLWPLTAKRAKPAVPIAGKYRLIDIAISNCLHADIRKMFILTQFASESLHRHIGLTYFFPPFSKGFAQILAAQQTIENSDWYQGTADAVRQNLTYMNQREIEYYLILSGDHLYRMDYREMLKTHIETGADVTVSVIPVAREHANQLGVLKTAHDGQIVDFYEKPQTPEVLNAFAPDQQWLAKLAQGAKQGSLLASMGIYLFSRKAFFEILKTNSGSDFGKDIFPDAIKRYRVMAYLFDGYWEDIGTISAFYDAMIALTEAKPQFDFFDEKKPIYTHARSLPGARLDHCEISESIICEAGRLREARVHKSIIGIRSRVNPRAVLDHVVLMGADYLENNEDDHQRNQSIGRPDIGIGEGTLIERAIIDKNARIGRNVKMLTEGRRDNATADRYAIRDGILIVPKSAVIADDSVIV